MLCADRQTQKKFGEFIMVHKAFFKIHFEKYRTFNWCRCYAFSPNQVFAQSAGAVE